MPNKKFTATVWGYSPPERSDELTHYASKYYDPVKAHEYYMRTRKLKGRQTAAPQTAKEQIKSELEEKQAEKAETAANEFNTKKAAIQRDIATLRAKYMGMNKEERAANKMRTKREIDSLRKQIRQERIRIGNQLGLDLSTLAEEYGEKIDALSAQKKANYTSLTKAGTNITVKDDRQKKAAGWMRDRITPETSSKSSSKSSGSDTGFIQEWLKDRLKKT